jgi:hypothetical protein
LIRLAHIVNPVKVPTSSDLSKAQPITFESMIRALEYSNSRNYINHYAIGYEEDRSVFPKDFFHLPNLERSVLDVNEFAKQRKLPLIQDILSPLRKNLEIDYIIYTNVDIALMPYFYEYIQHKINSGSDSMIINRRVIKEAGEFPLMYAEVGKSHPGFDCFVFRSELLEKFDLGNACIGANWIGRIMLANLIMFSNHLEIVKDAHLTFHVGEDGAWLNNNYSEFDDHNKSEAYRIIYRFVEITEDEAKQSQLMDILRFMDNWGKPKKQALKNSEKWTLKRKVKFKLRQYLK